LRQASGALAPGDLEPMLAAAGSVLAASGSGASAIDFSPGALQLRGLEVASDTRAAAEGPLQAQGYALRTEGESLWLRLGTAP